jgi:hypothetical protein
VLAAGVSDEDLSLLDAVSGAAISDATVNGVLIVEAPASRVQLDELVAHCVDGVGRRGLLSVRRWGGIELGAVRET